MAEGRWDVGLWDDAVWDGDPSVYASLRAERRVERGATASGQRQDIARAEAVAPGVARRIDE